MDGSGLPSLFIASSSEGLPVAHDLQEALEHDCHATVWPQAAFQAGQHVLPELVRQVKQHQFMLAVFTPDDPMRRRGTEAWAPRDNVVFERPDCSALASVNSSRRRAPMRWRCPATCQG